VEAHVILSKSIQARHLRHKTGILHLCNLNLAFCSKMFKALFEEIAQSIGHPMLQELHKSGSTAKTAEGKTFEAPCFDLRGVEVSS